MRAHEVAALFMHEKTQVWIWLTSSVVNKPTHMASGTYKAICLHKASNHRFWMKKFSLWSSLVAADQPVLTFVN